VTVTTEPTALDDSAEAMHAPPKLETKPTNDLSELAWLLAQAYVHMPLFA
jgi:hypothetical protein